MRILFAFGGPQQLAEKEEDSHAEHAPRACTCFFTIDMHRRDGALAQRHLRTPFFLFGRYHA